MLKWCQWIVCGGVARQHSGMLLPHHGRTVKYIVEATRCDLLRNAASQIATSTSMSWGHPISELGLIPEGCMGHHIGLARVPTAVALLVFGPSSQLEEYSSSRHALLTSESQKLHASQQIGGSTPHHAKTYPGTPEVACTDLMSLGHSELVSTLAS